MKRGEGLGYEWARWWRKVGTSQSEGLVMVHLSAQRHPPMAFNVGIATLDSS